MLGFFPVPYPDELLYSILARYHIRSGSVSPKATLQELFGSTTTIATIDLPANLHHLSQRIGHLTNYSATDLIVRYTLYPYYRPFLPPQRDRVLQKSMKAGKGHNIHTRAGIMASTIPVPKYLRFCPQCQTEALELYGELYWRRVHQIPGVLICPQHGIFLQDSSVSTQGFNRHQYYAPTQDNCVVGDEEFTHSQATREQLLTLAQDIEWLLNRNLPAHPPEYFEQQYRALLIDRGYANSNGRVDRERLLQDFNSFYTPELLTLLNSAVELGDDYNWLNGIVRHQCDRVFHPLRHLLLIRFLTNSLQIFFTTNYHYRPFGKPPWICLNPVAPHYRQAVVTKLEISHCAENKQPLGVFTCECGMIYSRTGPDRVEEDKYRIGKIIDFGELWRLKLRELVEEQKLGLRAVARELGVDTRTVKRYVSLLGLRSYWEQRVEPVLVNPELPPNNIDSLLPGKREIWMNLQREYPQLIKTELRKLAPDIYAWLYRHDRVWLNANSPTLKQPISQKVRVDWQQRDRDVCELVKGAVEEMLLEDKPVRITMSRIGKAIGLLALLEQHLDLMPMTGEYLGKVTESTADFQIRRIRWAIAELERRGEPVVEWRVIRLAGLGEDIDREVQEVLEGEIGG